MRLPGKEKSNFHGARPVHLIITMTKWIHTSRLSIKTSLFVLGRVGGRELTPSAPLRADSAHLGKSRPDSGLCFQINDLQNFEVVLSLLGNGRRVIEPHRYYEFGATEVVFLLREVSLSELLSGWATGHEPVKHKTSTLVKQQKTRHNQPPLRDPIVYSNCLHLYHKSPDSGARQYESRAWKGKSI